MLLSTVWLPGTHRHFFQKKFERLLTTLSSGLSVLSHLLGCSQIAVSQQSTVSVQQAKSVARNVVIIAVCDTQLQKGLLFGTRQHWTFYTTGVRILLPRTMSAWSKVVPRGTGMFLTGHRLATSDHCLPRQSVRTILSLFNAFWVCKQTNDTILCLADGNVSLLWNVMENAWL